MAAEQAAREEERQRIEAGSQPSGKRALEPFPLISICDIPEVVEQDWLVEGLLPRTGEGCAGYVFGPEKARKSLLLADIALSVATGTPALGRFAVRHPGAAVGFFAEDAKGETSRRFHRLARARGLEVPAHVYLINVPTLALDDKEHQERLGAALQSVDDLRFVWLDPMVRLHHIDDNRANELVPIHEFLRSLARSLPNVVQTLSHHANKMGGSRGSTDFPAFGDFNLFLRRVDDQTTEVHRIDNRGGPPGVPFRYHVEDGATETGPTMRLAAEDIQAVREAATARKDREAEELLRRLIAENPRASQNTLKKALRGRRLGVGNDRFSELWKRVRP